MKTYDTPSFRMVIHDNLLKEFTVKRSVLLTEDDIRTSLRYSEEFRPGAKYFVLVETEEGATPSHEARRLAGSQDYAGHTAALAMCSNNPLLAIAANLFLKINRPKMPTKFFEQREKALQWLNDMREAVSPVRRSTG
jgi:hypothetical protein